MRLIEVRTSVIMKKQSTEDGQMLITVAKSELDIMA